MFEAIKAFHEALRTDSTWPFVALMAIGGALLVALLAWVTDVSYKRKLEALSETVYPIVDFDFATEERIPPKLFLKITDRGEFQLRNVQMQVTEYTLQQRKAITQMSKFGGAALLTKQINSRGGESEPFDLQKGMPLQLEPLADNPPSTPVPVKHIHHVLLVDPHHRASGQCGGEAHAELLPCKATFAEESALVQNAYCGFLSDLRNHGEFYLSFLYVKNSIGRVALSKDRLPFSKSFDLSAAVDGRDPAPKKCAT